MHVCKIQMNTPTATRCDHYNNESIAGVDVSAEAMPNAMMKLLDLALQLTLVQNMGNDRP